MPALLFMGLGLIAWGTLLGGVGATDPRWVSFPSQWTGLGDQFTGLLVTEPINCVSIKVFPVLRFSLWLCVYPFFSYNKLCFSLTLFPNGEVCSV